MAIKFGKLYAKLVNDGYKVKDLVKSESNPNGVLSPASMAKLRNNANVNIETIDKLCDFLDCQPSDIMEFVREDKKDEV